MRRLARIDDLGRVVDLHISAFPNFFLTSLGRPFLLAMYRAFLESADGIFLVEDEEGRIHGFAVGALKTSSGDRGLAFRYFHRFLIAIVPAVIKNPLMIVKRIFRQLASEGGQPELPVGTVVLRSIAVSPSKKGAGIANALLTEFERVSLESGARRIALTTDAIDNGRAISFYLKNDYRIEREYKQDKMRPMLLLVKDVGAK